MLGIFRVIITFKKILYGLKNKLIFFVILNVLRMRILGKKALWNNEHIFRNSDKTEQSYLILECIQTSFFTFFFF